MQDTSRSTTQHRRHMCPRSQNIRETLSHHTIFWSTEGQAVGLAVRLSSFQLRNFSNNKYSSKRRCDGRLKLQVWIQGADNRVLLLLAPFQGSPGRESLSGSSSTVSVTAKHPNLMCLILLLPLTGQAATYLLLGSATPEPSGELLIQESGG